MVKADLDPDHIVLLDENHKIIGTAPKLASHNEDTPLHLAFSCHVFNTKGDYLLTRRALSKKVWPGVWTGTVCGHPKFGEDMVDAIKRRLDYELGMEATNIKVVLPNYRYKTDPFNEIIENELCPVYLALTQAEPQPNPDEVEAYRWINWPDVLKDIENNQQKYSYWFKDQVQTLMSDPVCKNIIDQCAKIA